MVDLGGFQTPGPVTSCRFNTKESINEGSFSVDVVDSDAEPVNGSDAVFAAVAVAAWARSGWAPDWPTAR